MVAVAKDWIESDEEREVVKALTLAAKIAEESEFSINEVLFLFKGQESLMGSFLNILRAA